jgi:hypothetical protein
LELEEENRRLKLALTDAENRIRVLEADSNALMDAWRVLGVTYLSPRPLASHIRELQDAADSVAMVAIDWPVCIPEDSAVPQKSTIQWLFDIAQALKEYENRVVGTVRAYWHIRRTNAG